MSNYSEVCPVCGQAYLISRRATTFWGDPCVWYIHEQTFNEVHILQCLRGCQRVSRSIGDSGSFFVAIVRSYIIPKKGVT